MDWIDLEVAAEVFDLFKEKHYPEPTPEMSEKELKHRCDQLWALDDLFAYLKSEWYFEDTPFELIGDYIDDARYRTEKYRDISPMSIVYKTAKETAEEILHCFESLTYEGEPI